MRFDAVPFPDLFQRFPNLGMEIDVVLKPLWVMDIDLFRSDVQVAAPDERIIGREVAIEVIAQAGKPLQLVGEHLRID